MYRKIASTQTQVTPLVIDPQAIQTSKTLETWLTGQAQQYSLNFLLAHAVNGVIWGRFEGPKLYQSGASFGQVSPLLNVAALQQARLFGPQAELMLWASDDGWQARLSQDGAGQPCSYYDEAQILWGSRHLATADGFTLVGEGGPSYRHAVPLEAVADIFEAVDHPLRLQVRHYLTQDDASGLWRVSLSRLVTLTVEDAQ